MIAFETGSIKMKCEIEIHSIKTTVLKELQGWFSQKQDPDILSIFEIQTLRWYGTGFKIPSLKWILELVTYFAFLKSLTSFLSFCLCENVFELYINK